VEEPLIRSYIFLYLKDDREYLKVLETDHVVRFITFAGKAAVIPGKQIEDIKLLLASEQELEVTHEDFEPGESIKVIAGQLRGLEGSLVEKRGRKRVQVKLEAIGQSILVEISPAYLAKKA
jgi:transcription antitermination factor NusG